MKRKRVYISGPISGLEYEKAAREFLAATLGIIEKHGIAVDVVNPIDLCRKEWTWEQCMRVCIVALISCDYIHMLPGYERSKGARLELTIAQALGFGVCNDQYDLVDYA